MRRLLRIFLIISLILPCTLQAQTLKTPVGASDMVDIEADRLDVNTKNGTAVFKGNVKAIRTDVLVDKAAEELYPTWRQNQEQWKLVGGDFGYHYLGSAIWFNRIGKAMGEAMLDLVKDQK